MSCSTSQKEDKQGQTGGIGPWLSKCSSTSQPERDTLGGSAPRHGDAILDSQRLHRAALDLAVAATISDDDERRARSAARLGGAASSVGFACGAWLAAV